MKIEQAEAFDAYQKWVMTKVNPDAVGGLAPIVGLGVAGESGEVADIVKKHVCQGHALDVEKLSEELGDVLWYVAVGATLAGKNLSDVMQGNVDKLESRYPGGFDAERSINRDAAHFVAVDRVAPVPMGAPVGAVFDVAVMDDANLSAGVVPDSFRDWLMEAVEVACRATLPYRRFETADDSMFDALGSLFAVYEAGTVMGRGAALAEAVLRLHDDRKSDASPVSDPLDVLLCLGEGRAASAIVERMRDCHVAAQECAQSYRIKHQENGNDLEQFDSREEAFDAGVAHGEALGTSKMMSAFRELLQSSGRDTRRIVGGLFASSEVVGHEASGGEPVWRWVQAIMSVPMKGGESMQPEDARRYVVENFGYASDLSTVYVHLLGDGPDGVQILADGGIDWFGKSDLERECREWLSASGPVLTLEEFGAEVGNLVGVMQAPEVDTLGSRGARGYLVKSVKGSWAVPFTIGYMTDDLEMRWWGMSARKSRKRAQTLEGVLDYLGLL